MEENSSVRNIDCFKGKKLHLALFLLHFPVIVMYNAHFMFYAAWECFARTVIRRTDVEDTHY
jgi:hypothetical protein